MQFFGGILIAIITGICTVLGQRYIASSSKRAQEAQTTIDQRKVDQATFELLQERMERELERYEKKLMALTHQQEQTQGWLAACVGHIRKLNAFWDSVLPSVPAEMRKRFPPVPNEITRLPYWFTNEEE